jgi:hypothetical protein
MNEFLEAIREKKRDAEVHGMKLDLIILHQEFYGVLMQAVGTMKPAAEAFEVRQHPRNEDRKDIYLHGVKVMWSGNRLPARQAWYRYSNPNMKTKV